jgi:diacylglycerol kinase family enzyme
LTSNWVGIANPGAGAFRFKSFRDTWMPLVSQHLARVIYTEAPGHATEIARASEAFDGVAVIGGDGTLFEVLAGITRPDQPLALIPAGRGNSLALDLGVRRIPAALAAITTGTTINLDLIEVEAGLASGGSRIFHAASTVAIGYVAAVVGNSERFSRLGHYAYTPAAVLTRPRHTVMTLAYGTEAMQRRKLTGIVINNTRYLANFLVFPRASLSDGLVDVLESRVGWTGQCLHNLSILTRRNFYDPVRRCQTPKLHICLDKPGSLMIDGERFNAVSELRVRCLAAAALFQQGSGA